MKKLQDLTTALQTICHEGDADKPVIIRILAPYGYYYVNSVKKVVIGDKTCVVLEAESV